MIELGPSEFAAVAPLFATIDHNVAIVFSVLEGNAPGRVFVDDPGQPRSAFLSVENAFSYVAGDESDNAFGRELVRLVFDDLLPTQGEQELVLFSFTDAWRAQLDRLLIPKRAIRIHRKTFAFDADKAPDFRDWRNRVPTGCRVLPITGEANDSRFGVELLKGDDAISQCRAVFVGHGEAEIAVRTAENHRHLGYGALAASSFLDACCARGLRPNWSCWPQREASIALAKKLGFKEAADVPVHLWTPDL